VAWIVVAFLLLSAWRAGLTMDGAPRPRIYQGPDTRSTALLAGAALSVYRHRYGVTVGEWAGKIGLSAVLFGAVFGWSVTWWPIVGQPVLETGVVLLLAAALCDTAIARGLAARPLVWIGRRSYSLYLWHGLVLSATLYVVGRNLLSLTIALGISVLVAQASYRYVEQPFRRRRSSAPVEQRKARERLVPGEPADQPL
jgi:peptidoglycan/LPS O-acetylase OafA/YrhL